MATDSAAEGLPPLHTVECCVVHLHGSYRDGSSMLNTDDELGTYKPHMHALLRDIVGSHGLLIAGWSAQWDHALRDTLRDTLRGNYRPFYTSAWINPSPLKGDAREVAAALGARAFEATADEAFTRLADAVTAMRIRRARHPLTAAVIVDRIKRDLAGAQPAITAHDTFAAETGRLEGLDALNLTQSCRWKTAAENCPTTPAEGQPALSSTSISTTLFLGHAVNEYAVLPVPVHR